MRSARLGLVALLLCGGALGCPRHDQEAKAASAEEPPPGQAWLTEQQIKDAKIEVAEVAEQDVDDVILTSGRITFDDLRVSHIFSPVTGRVTQINANFGQKVKKGETLAVIESPDIGIASSDLAKAQADLIAAEHDYKREKALWEDPKGHATSAKDLQTSEDNYRKAKAEMERAREKAFLLRTGGSADGGVSSSYALKSGIDGEVVGRNINPNIEVQGQYAGGTAVELFTVGELDEVWLYADVFEMDFARVKVGQKVTMRPIAYQGRTFDGTVEVVSGTLDPATRTAKVRCTFQNPKDDKTGKYLLRPEMYASVQISVDPRRALAIPRNAMLRLGDANVVFVEKGKAPDGRLVFERQVIAVDDEGEGGPWLPVKSGVTKGQRIVVSGAALLSSSR